MSAGSSLRKAVELEIPLQLLGAINAYCARLAERAGFKAIYLSGQGWQMHHLGYRIWGSRL
jgi:methylisocitrate lyase